MARKHLWQRQLFAALLLLLATTGAHAVTIDWTGGGDGTTYASAANWDGVEIPDTSGEDARFNVAATFDVLFGSGSTTTIGDLLVNAGTVTLDTEVGATANATYNIDDQVVLNGGTLIIADSASTFDVDLNITNQVTINNGDELQLSGGTFTAGGTVTMTSSATLTLDGGALNANAGLDNSAAGTLDFLDGTLTVTGGAFAPNAGGVTDDFEIDGPTPLELPHLTLGTGAVANIGDNLLVGIDRFGELTVTGGGMIFNDRGIIGDEFSSDGTVTVDGTGSTWMNSSDLLVGDNGTGTLNITDGGAVSNTTGFLGRDNSSIGTANVDGEGSTWTNMGDLRVGDNGKGTLNITDGGAVFNSLGAIGDSSFTSIATVDGTGSTWMNSSDLLVGDNGRGTLNITGGGAVCNLTGFIGSDFGSTGTANVDGAGSTWTNFSDLLVGGNGSGTLDITDGGAVSSSLGDIGGFPGSTGTVTVDGVGSTWTNSGGLSVGNSGGTGHLIVQNQGLVDVAGTLKIWGSGTVTLDGGSIVSDSVDNTGGGVFNFQSGSLTINSIMIGNDPTGMFPSNYSVDFDRHLITPGATTVDASRTLALTGGSLTTNSLVVNGSFAFNSGTLDLTGGSVTGLSQLNVPTNGTLRATGTHGNLLIAAATGSRITATGTLTLGDASSTSGFYSNGQVDVVDNLLTILDTNDAVFDSGAAVTLGSTGTGTLDAANGLTLDFGGNITGFGIVDTPDNAATPLINNGNITGISSPSQQIELKGYVKGVGTCDNCNITGTDAPGFSTAAVNRGSVSYNGTLEIEIGGMSPGSGFDQLNHILGAGVADLGGTLDVSLINGFTLTAGDTFEIITASSVIDTFDTINLPVLPGELLWFINYGATSVELVSTYGADFNEDGNVDELDYAAWEGGFGSSPAVHMTGDATTDNLAGGIDFLAWQRQFGSGGGAAVSASIAVPEPASWLLSFLAFALLTTNNRFRGR